jgi:hypothetical protein
MIFTQAVASAAAVGLGCGAGCGSAASTFLTTYVLSEGKKMRSSLSHVTAFYIGKMLAVVIVCVCGSVFGRVFIDESGTLAGFPLKKLVFIAMICTALWLIYGWFKKKKGCAGCRHCSERDRRVPTFAVGMAYGFSPCAPLLMVLGYAVLLSVPAAAGLGIVFSFCSSVIPAVMILIISGVLSSRISAQLGKFMPWFQIIVYSLYLVSGIIGLLN